MNIEQLRQIVKQFPDDPLGHFSLGNKLYELGESFADAKTHLLTAHELDSKHIATYLILGHVYAAEGEIDVARGWYERGLRMIPNVGPGEGQDLQADFEDALDELDAF